MKLTTKHYLIGGAVLVAAYLIWKHNQKTTTATLPASSTAPITASVSTGGTPSQSPNSQTVPITAASGN